MNIKNLLDSKYKEQIKQLKNQIKELSSLPQTYKSKDKVWFKETYIKSSKGFIVCRQYRSAKKRKNTLFFPTKELAVEYYITIPNKIFLLSSKIIDEVIPVQIENQINQFVDINEIEIGDKNLYLNEI